MVYLADKTADGDWIWCCRGCDWIEIGDEEQPTHRCGRGPCVHRGERMGRISVQCCPRGSIKPYAAHACRKHGACLTGFQPLNADMLRHWSERADSDDYALCSLCPDFEDHLKSSDFGTIAAPQAKEGT
jgi:hypothetical protein